MSALAKAQSALQDRILLGPAAGAPEIRGEDAGARLRVYADAYRLRLVEVLGHDFPGTRATLGDDPFASLVERYLQAHPSTRPSVRHVGSAFADWLQAQTTAPRGLHQLARFEWMQAAAFDAADAPVLGIDAVARVPAEAWPSLQLRLQPSAHLLDTDHVSVAEGAPCFTDLVTQARWLLWRDLAGDVQWRQLEADEADALHALAARTTFGELCERLSDIHGDDGALRAASLLKRWLADGLLAAD